MKPLSYIPTKQGSTQAVIIVGLCLALALWLTWMPVLDELAQRYLEDALSDSLVIYASARAINAVISVIQSIELSVNLGAGVAVNLGEALDPLNDLVERFSGFVLYGLTGLGIQQLVLVASSSFFTKVITSLVLTGSWLVWLYRGTLPKLLKKFLLLMIFVRFAFAIEVGVSWSLDKVYFDLQQQEAISTLDIARAKLEGVQEEYMAQIEDRGVFRGAWTTAKNLLNADDEKGITDLTVGALLQLLVIMLMRSILLPVGFMWLLFVLIRRYVAD